MGCDPGSHIVSTPGAEPACGRKKGVTPGENTGGRCPGCRFTASVEGARPVGRVSRPALTPLGCTIRRRAEVTARFVFEDPTRGAASAQTRGTASAGRAPPQTKNSNSGQVSAEGAGNRGGRAPAGAQTKARVPHDARPASAKGPPSALAKARDPLQGCTPARRPPRGPRGRSRRDTGSPRAWLPGETGWAERRGPLLSPAPLEGAVALVPGPRSPESLPGATSAHSPRGRPGCDGLCRQLPLVLGPGPEPGGMDAGGGARAPATFARRGGPSPRAPCLAGARAGDAHAGRAGSARSGRFSGRAGPPAPSGAARAGESGGGGGGGRTAGGRAGGGENAGGRGGGGARVGPTNPAPRRGSARAGPQAGRNLDAPSPPRGQRSQRPLC